MKLTINNTGSATNKYTVLGVETAEIKEAYNMVFENIGGALSVVADNDIKTKIDVAENSFLPTEQQITQMWKLGKEFIAIQHAIDPERLMFTITNTIDGEICFNKKTQFGVSKIIIHDDGMIAISYISFDQAGDEDYLDFVEGEIDYEALAYKFLS